MIRLRLAAMLALALIVPSLAAAQARYTVRTQGDIVQLRDARTDTVVSVLTPVNNAYEMVVKGHNVLRMAATLKSVDDMRLRPGQNGIPFLHPFANRLDETAFYANGKKYNFDMEMGNVRGPVPIHGYLSGTNAWKVVEAKADANGAWVTSKLEFWRYPQYMAQFPFAHNLTMTYRLSDMGLEVRTRIDNLADEPMPVSLGFHPYFQVTDSNRADWVLSVPAATHLKLDNRLIPNGETEPAATFWGGDVKSIPLSRFNGKLIDDGFTDLIRDAQGRTAISLQGKAQKVTVTFGPKYQAALIYSPIAPPVPRPAGAAPAGPPPGANQPPPVPVSKGPNIPFSATKGEPAPPERGTVAIEPMAAITNGLNFAQKGAYKQLQSVAPGGSWQESFWISASGY